MTSLYVKTVYKNFWYIVLFVNKAINKNIIENMTAFVFQKMQNWKNLSKKLFINLKICRVDIKLYDTNLISALYSGD